LFYEVPSPSPIYPDGIGSFFLEGELAGGVKMILVFHFHPVLSSATPKPYLQAPMCLQFVYAESFIFHLFGSQNITNEQAVRVPKK